MGRALALLRGRIRRRIKVTRALLDDLGWWKEFLPSWPGVGMVMGDTWVTSGELELWTDASQLGAGGVFGDMWFSHEWSMEELEAARRSKRVSMVYLELLAVGLAVSTWGERLKGKQVVLYSDNQGAIAALNRMRARDLRLLALVRAIVGLTIRWQFVLKLKYIPSLDNTLADPLSRLDVTSFMQRRPEARLEPSVVEPLLTTGC